MSFITMPKGKFAGRIAAVMLAAGLFTGCVHKKYETPITKNTQQPDKVLFDSAMKDIEHGRYEVARISLQTLMNTYDSSEYMAKAKLAIADSWFREGGANGMAQAEAEYKDFQLFYPGMEESPQAQSRICDIHYKQMDKSDRDIIQTLRAEDECKALIVNYPNSKFVPDAQQKLRNIQESLAAHEMTVGEFYWKRQMNPAAANRLNALADQYPLFSQDGDALYEAGDAYSKMGPRFRKQAGEMFSRVVSDYPLSDKAKLAAKRLQDMELPVPPVNQAALERAKWEEENRLKPGLMSKTTGLLKGGPDVSHAARSGMPTMTDPKRTFPASIPMPTPDTGTSGTGTTDVSVANSSGSALDSKPDARTGSQGSTSSNTSTTTSTAGSNNAPLPTNRDAELKKMREQQAKKQAKLDKKKKKAKDTEASSSNNSSNSSSSQGTTDAPKTDNKSQQ